MNTIAPLLLNRIYVELSGYEDRDKFSYENDFRAGLDKHLEVTCSFER